MTSSVLTTGTDTSTPIAIPTLTTQYPTAKPNRNNAFFTFKFTIVGDNTNFLNQWQSTLRDNVTDIFSGTYGFIEVSLYSLRRKRTTRRLVRRATDRINLAAKFEAKKLQTEGEKQQVLNNLTALTPVLKKTLKQQSYSLDIEEFRDQATEFAAKIEDVCKSEGGKLCGPLYNCRENSCLYKCEGHYCGQHGVCFIQHLNGTATPKCLCSSSSVYEYSGDQCDDKSMKVKWVAGIAGGVCGVVVLIVLFVTCCLCACCQRRRRNKVPLDDSLYEMQGATGDVASRQTTYRRSVIAPRYRTSYDNAAYQPSHGAEYYLTHVEPDHSVYRFYETPRSNFTRETRDTQTRSQDTRRTPSLGNIDLDSEFAIQRPHVSTTPLHDE
ncbi:hypothetical protein V1264_011531 [Littorina saxatilis]|uniref:Uncharacterized protein n=2 Tax=Littorina saxatilis TaxID=31220 RepID=A0AAN9BV64_9CAEN